MRAATGFLLVSLVGCGASTPPRSVDSPAAEPAPLDAREARSEKMSVDRLERVLRTRTKGLRGRAGIWEFAFEEVPMVCMTSAEHDRVRIVARIISVRDLTPIEIAAVLEANFHSALDVRYGTSRGHLYAAFMHPLSGLSDAQVSSALRQIASTVRTFGTSYTSGELQFR